MSYTPTQNTIFEVSNELDTVLIKLRFMSDVMRYWNIKEFELTDMQLFGYGLVTEEIIEQVDKLNKKLEEQLKG